VQEFLRLHNEDIISGVEKLLRKHKTENTKQNAAPVAMQQHDAEMEQA